MQVIVTLASNVFPVPGAPVKRIPCCGMMLNYVFRNEKRNSNSKVKHVW
jgi:hypothetical protein